MKLNFWPFVSDIQKIELEIKEPHEIYPDIVDWVIGDNILQGYTDYKFLGILDRKVYLKKSPSFIKEVYIEDLVNYPRHDNISLQLRKTQELENFLEVNLQEDNYNIFLKELREVKQELWQKYISKKQE